MMFNPRALTIGIRETCYMLDYLPSVISPVALSNIDILAGVILVTVRLIMIFIVVIK